MTTRTSDPGLPADYDPSQFPAFAVTVDVVILTMSDGMLHVLLVRRGEAPFEGMWAIPGGFKRPTETLDEAAKRELREETGVDVASVLAQFGAYGDPGRDPRMNVVTVAYLAVLRDVGDVVAGTDAADAALTPVSDVLEREAPAGVRPPANRARRDRARARRARGLGHGDGIRGNDVHDGRAAHGVRGDLGRPARRRELQAQHPRRGRLGDPDRAPGAAWFAGRAGPPSSTARGGPGSTAARSTARHEPTRGSER